MNDDQAPDAPDGNADTITSAIMSPTEQVGRNVMTALKDADAIAVITTLVPGMGQDRVVSMGLTAEQMSHIGALLQEINDEAETDANDDTRCIGFQCRIPKA